MTLRLDSVACFEQHFHSSFLLQVMSIWISKWWSSLKFLETFSHLAWEADQSITTAANKLDRLYDPCKRTVLIQVDWISRSSKWGRYARCYMLYAAWYAVCHMSYVICQMLYVICYMAYVICHMSSVICHINMPYICCHVSDAICNRQHVICHIRVSYVTCHVSYTICQVLYVI